MFHGLGTLLPQNPNKINSKKNQNKTVIANERVRLHGAFQGGFSAGYYNTVGSKEGWTPSSNKQQSITDFMDEQDLQEFGSTLLKQDYSSLGSTQSELQIKKISSSL